MSSRPIPATAANLIETSQLRRRYYSAQVYAQTQVHSLFLSLSYSGGTTRDTTGESSERVQDAGVKHHQLPNSGLLLRLTKQKDLI
ncbi:unnamed protein product, partial [Brenthis ino]